MKHKCWAITSHKKKDVKALFDSLEQEKSSFICWSEFLQTENKGRVEMTYWRDLLSIEDEVFYGNMAHKKLKSIIKKAPLELKNILQVNYHELGGAFFFLYTFSEMFVSMKNERFVLDGTSIETKLLEEYGGEVSCFPAYYQIIPRVKSPIKIGIKNILRKVYVSYEKTKRFFSSSIEKPSLVEKNSWVMSVEDSGTGVNLAPAIEIIKECRKKNKALYILTSSEKTLATCKAYGARGEVIPCEIDIRDRYKYLKLFDKYCLYFEKQRKEMTSLFEALAFSYILSRLTLFIKNALIPQRVFSDLIKKQKINGFIGINSGIPAAVSLGNISLRRKLPWVSYNSILVFDHPETKFYPAPLNLIYGEQGRDILKIAGCSDKNIITVGSVIFDLSLQRDFEQDLSITQKMLPHWEKRSEKLVVIGTEARPGQVEEIKKIVSVLRKINHVFVVLKLHPSDRKEDFSDEVFKLCHIIEKCDLDALLHTASLLICLKSNIIINAAIMGTPTLACKFSQIEFEPVNFEKEGIALGCFSENDLEKKLEDILFNREKRKELLDYINKNLSRFNGLNDGKSAERIVEILSKSL